MSPEAAPMDFERMLRQALAPVDPPESLKTRVETTLQELTDAAVDELEAFTRRALDGHLETDIRVVPEGPIPVAVDDDLRLRELRRQRRDERQRHGEHHKVPFSEQAKPKGEAERQVPAEVGIFGQAHEDVP